MNNVAMKTILVFCAIVFQSFINSNDKNGILATYTNKELLFSMNYPAHWKIASNTNTVIAMVNKDSAISLGVTVNKLPNNQVSISLWREYDNDKNAKQNAIAGIESTLKRTISDYQMSKIKITGREAIKSSFTFIQQTGEIKQQMRVLLYQVYISPYFYSIAIYVPEVFYKGNPKWFNSAINGFIYTPSKK